MSAMFNASNLGITLCDFVISDIRILINDCLLTAQNILHFYSTIKSIGFFIFNIIIP